ncbi:MAG TPA: hypothetical protein VFA78_09795, partial [Chloroflexota bacterium]|nr:hypothetical protein [Chloroflexota bacterium]
MSRLESLRKGTLAGALVAASVIATFPARGASASVDPSKFNLTASDVTGWTGSVTVSREESNSHAAKASRVADRYFYTGSLAALRRTGGWIETMTLSQGRVKANVVDLVSLFSSERQATAAYHAMVSPLKTTTSSLSIGSGAISFIASRGVGSGPNIVVWFQRGDVY